MYSPQDVGRLIGAAALCQDDRGVESVAPHVLGYHMRRLAAGGMEELEANVAAVALWGMVHLLSSALRLGGESTHACEKLTGSFRSVASIDSKALNVVKGRGEVHQPCTAPQVAPPYGASGAATTVE